MPPKRATRTSSRGTQGTLSFGSQNRITKPTTSPPAKKTKKDPAVLEAQLSREDLQPATDSAHPTPTKRQRTTGPPPAEDPLASISAVKTEDVLGGRSTPEPEVEAQDEDEKADDEAALKLSVAKVKAYWREKENARLAPRVHQQELSLGEKILREWDMSGQFGPCIGISRLRRWRRARRLGLEPPLEVLAVLLGKLDGEEKGRGKKEDGEDRERAYVDLLMGNRMVVV